MKRIVLGIFILVLCNHSLAQDAFDCSDYRTGFYEFERKHSDVIIYRNEEYQIEYNIENGQWVTIKLNWTSDCNYSFTYLDTNMDGLKQYLGHSLDVEILSGDSTGYEYYSYYSLGRKEFDGKITYLTTNLSDKNRKKIIHELEKRTGK